MIKRNRLVHHVFASTLLSAGFMATSLPAADWPQFLGPNGTAKSLDAKQPPTTWSDTENLKWSVDLPGRGVSSPIVVGNRVVVTCYSGYGTGGNDQSMENLVRHVVCVDRQSGKVLWSKEFKAVLPEDPYQGAGVPAHGYASHTPTSDGERIYAFFGKGGVVALDLEGNELWQASVGTGSGPQRWGSAASPVVHADVVIVPATEEAEAVVALDKLTGKEIWRSEAESFQGTWSTPTIATAKNDSGEEQTDVVISVPGEVWGLNPETGKMRWYARGTTDSSTSASLVPGDGVVYATGGRSGDAVAVKLGGKGDVNDSKVVWDANIPGRFATPVLHEGHLYSFASGVVTCYDASTGERIKQQRIGEGREQAEGGPASESGGRRGGGMGNLDYASPVLAGDYLYVTTKSGAVYVLRATPELEIIATNRLNDRTGFDGTPAISNGELFFRSGSRLYCIAD